MELEHALVESYLAVWNEKKRSSRPGGQVQGSSYVTPEQDENKP